MTRFVLLALLCSVFLLGGCLLPPGPAPPDRNLTPQIPPPGNAPAYNVTPGQNLTPANNTAENAANATAAAGQPKAAGENKTKAIIEKIKRGTLIPAIRLLV